MLVALSLLCLVGLRNPVAMLPLLLFEVVWKLLWLGLVALPLALRGPLDAITTSNLFSCALVVVVIAAVPWRYAWRAYAGRGDRWR